MNYPMILVCGQSGSGKSYSLRNLDKERTKIINIERKILPFKEALKFKHYVEVDNSIKASEEIKRSLSSDEYDIIVIESFTKYVELLLAYSKNINKGYDIYNYYNSTISSFLEAIKGNQNKFIIITAIDERVEFIQPTGAITTSRRCAVSGKEWEGKIEKEFTVVLFTDVKQEKGKNPEYRFITNNDGTNSSKSPPDLFGKQYIENDINFIINKMIEYYELKQPTDFGDKDNKIKLPILSTYGNK